MGYLIVGLVFWALVGGGVGAAIGNGKGRKREGFFSGFFFGPIGWIIIAVMEATPEAEIARMVAIRRINDQANPSDRSQSVDTRNCQFCAETIKSAAVLCRFCGKDVVPIKQSDRMNLHSSATTLGFTNAVPPSSRSKTRWCVNGHAVTSGSVLCDYCGVGIGRQQFDSPEPSSKLNAISPVSKTKTRWCVNGHSVTSGSDLCDFCGVSL